MPKFALWIMNALETHIGGIIMSALLSLGISFTTYKFTVAPFTTFIQNQMGGLGAQAISILGFLGVDKAITIILSAIAARYAVQGAKAILTKGKAA